MPSLLVYFIFHLSIGIQYDRVDLLRHSVHAFIGLKSQILGHAKA